MTLDELKARYRELCHAMQTGVAITMGPATEPKHLRVGINVAMSDNGALAALLIKKGIITEHELLESLVEGMAREVATYEQEIGVKLG